MDNAKKYNNIKLAVGIGEGIVSFILLLLFVYLGFSLQLENFLSNYFSNQYLLFISFLFAIGIVGSVLSFPISYYTGFYLEHKYNLSNQTFWKWILEGLKGMLVSLVIGVPILLTFYYVLNTFYSLWWLPFAIIMFFISVVLSQIFPVLIFPIFYKVTPLDNDELKQKINSLATNARIKVENIYRFDMSKNTKKANAAFTGLGKTKRIILGDTLLDKYSVEEIESVIAHELGHYQKEAYSKKYFHRNCVKLSNSIYNCFALSELFKLVWI